jgi:hypothetical protein
MIWHCLNYIMCGLAYGVPVTSADFFGYQIGDDGRLILPGLTQEETFEFELLSRRDRTPDDRSSEMRELELYLKRHKAVAAQGALTSGGTPPGSFKIVQMPFVSQAQYRHGAPRLSNRAALATIAVLGLMGAGFITVLLLFAGNL